MQRNRWITMAVCLLLAAIAPAQTKLERESRLQLRDVHPDARAFVERMGFPGRVKWYYEENLKGNSMEAKSKKDGKRYSVEFDTEGRLQDIEVETDVSAIPKASAEQMEAGLDSVFTCHKIKKIQVQYAGPADALLALSGGARPAGNVAIQYELIVKAKKEKQAKLYEIGFDAKGKLLEIAEIVFANTENLEY